MVFNHFDARSLHDTMSAQLTGAEDKKIISQNYGVEIQSHGRHQVCLLEMEDGSRTLPDV